MATYQSVGGIILCGKKWRSFQIWVTTRMLVFSTFIKTGLEVLTRTTKQEKEAVLIETGKEKKKTAALWMTWSL